VLDAFRHQDVPFQWIAERPALRRVPLSRLLFSLDTPWPPALALDGVEAAPLPVETGAADFDLSVSLWNEGAALHGTLRYKRALFDAAAAGALAEGLHAALAMLAADPATPVAALPSLAVADGDAPQATGPVLPRTPLELRLARLWEEIFDRRPVGVRDGLQALGASSIAVAALAERIQAEFRTDLPVTALFRAGTVERMAEVLQSRDGALLDSPLAPIRAGGSRPPLFLCEGVGVYYPLAGRLDPEQPVWGLVTELVGAYPGVEALAAHYVAAIRAVQPHGPYRLGGLSFGGLVAFEMAQQLIAAGEDVALLVLFDTPGPGAYRPKALPGRLVGHMRNMVRYGTPYLTSKLGRRLRRRAGPDADAGEARRLIADQHRLRTLFHGAAARYAVQPYPGRITLFALESRDGMGDGLFDPALGHIDPTLGWAAVARGGVDHHAFTGEHVSMLHEPHVAAVAAALDRCLAGA
jgi:thioesterase domain-containing protein